MNQNNSEFWVFLIGINIGVIIKIVIDIMKIIMKRLEQ